MYSPEEHVLTQVLQVRPKSVSVKQPHTSSYYEAKDWKLGAGLWTRLGKGQLQSCVHKPAAFICVPAFIFLFFCLCFFFPVRSGKEWKSQNRFLLGTHEWSWLCKSREWKCIQSKARQASRQRCERVWLKHTYTHLRLQCPPEGRDFPGTTGFHYHVCVLRCGGFRRFVSLLSIEHQLGNRGQEMKWNWMY